MKLDLNVIGLDKTRAMLAGFSERRLAATAATALTRTAVEVKAEEVAEMGRALDRPTPYTLNALFMRPATAQRQVAEVWLKDDRAGSGTVPARFLLPQIEGGPRREKRLETALRYAGALPAGWLMVPGAGARLDAYGNVSRGQIIQILSQLRIQLTAGFSRSLNLGGSQQANSARRRAFGRAGGQIFVLPNGRGKLPAGIYVATGRDFGARLGYGRTGKLQAIFVFKRSVTYHQRFDFFGVAQRVVDAKLGGHFERAFEENVAILRAKAVAT